MFPFLADVTTQVQPNSVDWLSLLFKDAPVTGFFVWVMFKGFPQLVELAKWGHLLLVTSAKETEQRYLGLLLELRTDRNEDRKLRELQHDVSVKLQLELHELNLRIADIKTILALHPSSTVVTDETHLFRGATNTHGIAAGSSTTP